MIQRSALHLAIGLPCLLVAAPAAAVIKRKGAEIYANSATALPYQIDPEQIDDALEPLELQVLLQVLTADADYLVH